VNRLTTLLIAASALGAAPLPALAQTWPAAVVASAPRAAPAPANALVVLRREEAGVRRLPGAPPTDPTAGRAALKLADSAEDVPNVDLRPKAEWSDDQGWRASPTRVAFKRRF
jgi:hypothetical protein